MAWMQLVTKMWIHVSKIKISMCLGVNQKVLSFLNSDPPPPIPTHRHHHHHQIQSESVFKACLTLEIKCDLFFSEPRPKNVTYYLNGHLLRSQNPHCPFLWSPLESTWVEHHVLPLVSVSEVHSLYTLPFERNGKIQGLYFWGPPPFVSKHFCDAHKLTIIERMSNVVVHICFIFSI